MQKRNLHISYLIVDDSSEKCAEMTSTAEIFKQKYLQFSACKGKLKHLRQLAILRNSMDVYGCYPGK